MSYKKIDFSKYSSIKIGPELDVYILDACDTKGMKDAYLIGSCNNILIGDNPPPLMKLAKIYDYIKIEDNLLKIGGATPSGKIASFCKKNNISDFEFVSHLPGTLGGLVYMNAGLKEFEIFNHLISIVTCRGEFVKDEIEYSYRFTNIDSPILEATFELNNKGFSDLRVEMFKKMRSNQPRTPSAGSCFKNPEGDYAGRLIEAVGLKGVKKGDMEFSLEHANFLVNHGNGTYQDALYLIKEAQRLVYEEFKIELELEIQILDEEFITI
ncbi:UDP-N-acetylmuramate dehydrogenase [Sulfurimonas sp.]|uniref:UDP-N-acetylmuramate dehydrogenase n=1 Tax=Sulfurimonas sp. TaxID=2022749 RepID=UPI00356883CA